MSIIFNNMYLNIKKNTGKHLKSKMESPQRFNVQMEHGGMRNISCV